MFGAGMPYDTFSVVTIGLAALLLGGAWRLHRWTAAARLALVLAAALLIRIDAAWQRSLYRWDESFHALVAKNLREAPLRPTLYRNPALPYDHRDWGANHVWLHKPPGALWLMAGSMSLFGVNELAARVPSVVLSTLGVAVTFLLGRMLLGPGVGLLAAGFHAVNGFLVAQAAGRRVADHVDTALVFAVTVAVWAAARHWVAGQWWWLVAAGLALGAGLLTKSFPALVVVAFVVILHASRDGWRAAWRPTAVVLAIGAAVAAPWSLYTAVTYPREAEWTARYTLIHMTQVVEGQATRPWTYVRDLFRYFNPFVLLLLAPAVVTALRDRREAALRAILVWAAVPYVVFSLSATRLPGYVMTAAPALFLLQAWGWHSLATRARNLRAGGVRFAAAITLTVMAVASAAHLLEPSGVFEKRDRHPRRTRDLTRLEERLGLRDAVLFNVPDANETMFYTPYTAYEQMPTSEQVRELRARGLAVVIYRLAGQRLDVPPDWDVILADEQQEAE